MNAQFHCWLENGSVGSRPSGVAGTSARLNQSAGIASYVTLRRSTSTAAVKVRVLSWSQNWNQPAENESVALVFLVHCLVSAIYLTSPERSAGSSLPPLAGRQQQLNSLLYGPHKAVPFFNGRLPGAPNTHQARAAGGGKQAVTAATTTQSPAFSINTVLFLAHLGVGECAGGC